MEDKLHVDYSNTIELGSSDLNNTTSGKWYDSAADSMFMLEGSPNTPQGESRIYHEASEASAAPSTTSTNASTATFVHDWNAEFQDILETLQGVLEKDADKLQVYRKLAHLAQDFVSMVRQQMQFL